MVSFVPVYKRYQLWKIFLIVTAVSFGAFLYAYLSKFILNEPFSWKAYNEYLVNQTIGTIASALFYYYALNQFHYFFQQRKPLSSFILSVVLCIIVVEVYNLAIDYLHPLQSNIDDPPSPAGLFIGYLFLGLIYVGIALLIAYVNYLRDERKKHKRLKEQALQLEVEKMQADLKFLK